MTATIQQNNAAAQTRWADKVYTQHFDENVLSALTTPGEGGIMKGAIIKEDFAQKTGEKVIYHFRNELPLSSVVEGETRLEGSGVDIQRGTDEFSVKVRGSETDIRNLTASQQRTKHDLVDEAGKALAR
jgi:hypothetical protein